MTWTINPVRASTNSAIAPLNDIESSWTKLVNICFDHTETLDIVSQ